MTLLSPLALLWLASIPVLVLPLVTFAITVVTQAIMLVMGSVLLLASGQSLALLRTHV